MSQAIGPVFALNHRVAPGLSVDGLLALAGRIGVDAIELRDDLEGLPLADGSSPATVRAQAERAGVRVLSVNALQRFNDWTPWRQEEAETLAGATRAAGGAALVLCPVNEAGFALEAGELARCLAASLAKLAPILRDHGVMGLVEPLGFAESSLRTKQEALAGIEAVGAGDVFALLHDTFHHHVAGETELFARQTGLVHISGVTDRDRTAATMRDGDRGLVDRDDRTGALDQIAALRRAGYQGAFSFEPFADQVWQSARIEDDLLDSMNHIRQALGAPIRQALGAMQ